MSVELVVFVVLSLVALGGALGVVLNRALFRSALFLVLSFVGVAGYYLLLQAGLLAMVQLLIYVGAIAVLIIFAIMLSRQAMQSDENAFNEPWWLPAVVGLLLFAGLAYLLLQVKDVWPAAQGAVPPNSLELLGTSLISTYALPFEVASVLLLVALVGAVVIAREK